MDNVNLFPYNSFQSVIIQYKLQTSFKMDFYHFADEAAVMREAQKIINRVLSDKSYINSEKLSLLISEYQKKQIRLDAQLSKSIKSQIQSIIQSKDSISEANNWMKEANQKTQLLREIWNDQYGFHELMEDVAALNIYQNNLGKVIQQLTYFIDMESQMSKLQKMAQDESKYQIVNLKLLNLISLRDALLDDSSWKRETAIMRKQFVKVDNFEISFYDKIFHNFNDCIQSAQEKQASLAISVKVIQAYDKALEQRGKPRVMRDRAIQMIKQSISNKFEQELSGQDDLFGIIQHAKFATVDLVTVSDYVDPCFPKDFPIMQIYQQQYQQNIEKHILPFFEQIEEEQQYGHLVALLSWIDDYETMLSRAGLDSTKLVDLKSKVKILLPHFIDHNQKLFHDYITNCYEGDQKNYCRSFYEANVRDGSQMVSLFPSDVFRFINQQAELIRDQLKGQIFVEFVRCITQTLGLFQRDMTNEVLEQFEAVKMLDNEERIVDFEYKCVLFINNYNECLKHATQSKQLFTEMVSQDFKNRIDKIFLNEVQREFNSSIPKFINCIVRIIFLNLMQSTYTNLFTTSWLEDNSRQIMTTIMKTIATEIKDIEQQGLLMNIIHQRMLVKDSLQFAVNAYVQQLILSIRILYNMPLNQDYRFCNEAFTQKKLSEIKDPRAIFKSKVAISQAIKKDKHIYLKFSESFSQNTSKMFINKQINKFILLGELFMKKKGDFEALLIKVAEQFPQQAADLTEVIFIVRDDIETRNSQKNRQQLVVRL